MAWHQWGDKPLPEQCCQSSITLYGIIRPQSLNSALQILIEFVYFFFFSLLKVHLQLKGFTVFLDIEKLQAGKFDDNLLYNVRSARNFILVLTPNALDRCLGDLEHKDWVHRVSNSTVSWRHDMEMLSTSLALCDGNLLLDSPHNGTVM